MFDPKKQAKANATTTRRLANGEITKPHKCTRCYHVKNLCAHHPDYDNPEYIVWLCPKCHCKAHKQDSKQDRLRRKNVLIGIARRNIAM